MRGDCANSADPEVLGAPKAKLRVGLSGALPSPFKFISLAGLSSIVTSSSTLGGVADRAGALGVNEKAGPETSAAFLSLDGAPKVYAGVVAGAGVPKENTEGGLVSMAGCAGVEPKENRLDGFSSVFLVSAL